MTNHKTDHARIVAMVRGDISLADAADAIDESMHGKKKRKYHKSPDQDDAKKRSEQSYNKAVYGRGGNKTVYAKLGNYIYAARRKGLSDKQIIAKAKSKGFNPKLVAMFLRDWNANESMGVDADVLLDADALGGLLDLTEYVSEYVNESTEKKSRQVLAAIEAALPKPWDEDERWIFDFGKNYAVGDEIIAGRVVAEMKMKPRRNVPGMSFYFAASYDYERNAKLPPNRVKFKVWLIEFNFKDPMPSDDNPNPPVRFRQRNVSQEFTADTFAQWLHRQLRPKTWFESVNEARTRLRKTFKS